MYVNFGLFTGLTVIVFVFVFNKKMIQICKFVCTIECTLKFQLNIMKYKS